MSSKNVFRKLMTRAFRPGSTLPIRKLASMQQAALRVEGLEDRIAPATYVFSNPASILIPGTGTDGPASPYPSNIAVSNLAAGSGTGLVTNVTATIVDYSHTFPDDTNVLLTSPSPAVNAYLMGDAGGAIAIAAPGVTYTFADGNPLLNDESPASPSGTYSPSLFGDSGTEVFPAPAPAGPLRYGTLGPQRHQPERHLEPFRIR